MKDPILIVGTGALASLFAARLSQADWNVTMLGRWKSGLDAIRENGIRYIDTHGREHQFSVRVTANPHDCVGTTHALVLVKAWQTPRAAKQLKECLAEDGLAVTLQNGLGNRETLIRSLGRRRVALGVTTTGATLLGPGLVKAGGEGPISIERNPALALLDAALTAAKFNVRIVDDASSLMWGKLVINSAINPLTALLRVNNGELLKRPTARELLGQLARETARVAIAEGVHLPFEDPVAAAEDVAHKTAANQSSMLQDVLRGAPTEIDAICGAVVKAAKKHSLTATANWACWQLIKALK